MSRKFDVLNANTFALGKYLFKERQIFVGQHTDDE